MIRKIASGAGRFQLASGDVARPLPRLALVVFTVLAIGAPALAKKAKKPEKLQVKAVWSATWCYACHNLQEGFLRKGSSVLVTPKREYPKAVKEFPYYEYTDGTFDNGDKVRASQATIPNPVPFYEVVQ